MKIISEIELEGSEVVEITARALYAHANFPGSDPMTVPWPPKSKQTLMGHWNKAKAVVKAQRAYVERLERERTRRECLGLPPLAAGIAVAEVTRKDHGENLVPDTQQSAGAACDISRESQ